MDNKKVVIVTGASRGIGRATAKLFLEKGCIVYALARSGCDLSGVNSVVCDVTDGTQLKNAIDGIAEAEKHIDILINNAGSGISGAVEKTVPADARRLFELNFFAPFEAIKYTIPYMRGSKGGRGINAGGRGINAGGKGINAGGRGIYAGGKIINIGSIAGAMHIPFQTFYSASKAALEALTNSLRGELAPFGIKLTTIMPGDTRTNFTDAREKDFEKEDPDYGRRIYNSIKLMEEDERNGIPPETVAQKIYRAACVKNPKPAYIVGFKYNFFAFLNRALPKRLVQWVLNLMYAK